MNRAELLFKLKKDGKCVGYARFGRIGANGLQLEYWWSADWESEKVQWDWHHNFPYDSIHPFICQDRHGKDVFEGDEIQDRRDGRIETMTPSFWWLSLECNAEHIELAGPVEGE